ncbi:MAG: RluA family pseudouridine synthase [Planctomycetota bacterium]|nr:MAG: RluA family pseudouridine synthase [Planctomycetota bacterium]
MPDPPPPPATDVPATLPAGAEVTLPVGADDVGSRLDVFLCRAFPARSRSFLARAIDQGAVRVDGVTARSSLKLRSGALVRFTVPAPPRTGPEAEEIPLRFLHLDEWIAAVDKPAGMVVHPAKGNWKGTLAGALKWHLQAGDAGLSTSGGPTRPGIVHRLDRDTSGVIVVARTEEAHHALARQFERRTVEKTYLAITQGAPQLDRDEINLPIGIHPYQREKMAVRRDHATSREALTRFEVLERFAGAALVRVTPRTGRTHQIRVHLAAIGFPVLCDGLYSGRTVIEPAFIGRPPGPALLMRQALHAAALSLDHPVTRQRMEFTAPLPDDMQGMIDALRNG